MTPEEAALAMWAILQRLRDDEREMAVAELRERVCLDCGQDQPLHRSCQCWNEE